ncbi:MAG: OmpA family protein [Flavobacteriaceae bacterium]|nr:OmpA family protein [Flavobacteriaceae bacterium]
MNRSCLICFSFLVLIVLAGKSFGQSESNFSLYYENDVYELTNAQLQLLDSIRYHYINEDIDVHIKGFTNTVGTEVYNLELSRKRADNVKDELDIFTIISSMGHGELNDEAATNRRVDVLLHARSQHKTVPGEIIEPPRRTTPPTPSLSLSDRLQIGDRINLEGIMFYPDRDVIMDESRETLEELVHFLLTYPNVHFKLIGHICCGDKSLPAMDVVNIRTGKRNLSEARAQSLHNYLVRKGVDKKRIRYVGMAYRSPTGKGDRFDRRVEIEITDIK